MFAEGVDPYALLLAEARRHGLEALLTYRMNDIHGDPFLEHKFWLQHPEYRLAKPYDSWAVRHAGLDFGHDAVRDYTFRLIEEAVQRYDCDGIELDFVRCPAFFQNGPEAERIAKMNDLVRRVRQMLDAEGQKRAGDWCWPRACFPGIRNAEVPALTRSSGQKRAGSIFSPFLLTRARNTICPSSLGKRGLRTCLSAAVPTPPVPRRITVSPRNNFGKLAPTASTCSTSFAHASGLSSRHLKSSRNWAIRKSVRQQERFLIPDPWPLTPDPYTNPHRFRKYHSSPSRPTSVRKNDQVSQKVFLVSCCTSR